jgi:nitrite reductase/ring-hydroxylating ferredoxin subunit
MSELVRLCAKSDVPTDRPIPVRVAGYETMAVCQANGSFYALSDLCSHGLASLSEGEVADGQVICPFHGGAFDVCTGKATEAPCTVPIATYPVIERGDELFVEAKA